MLGNLQVFSGKQLEGAATLDPMQGRPSANAHLATRQHIYALPTLKLCLIICCTNSTDTPSCLRCTIWRLMPSGWSVITLAVVLTINIGSSLCSCLDLHNIIFFTFWLMSWVAALFNVIGLLMPQAFFTALRLIYSRRCLPCSPTVCYVGEFN